VWLSAVSSPEWVRVNGGGILLKASGKAEENVESEQVYCSIVEADG
jgi:hypothetical protein